MAFFPYFNICLAVLTLGLKVNSLIVAKSSQAAPVTQLHQSPPTSASVAQGYGNDIMNTYSRYPLTVSHGKGTKLYDVEGREYLDCTAGIATSVLGHANPALKKAITEQLDRVNHVSNLYFIPEQAALAKWIKKGSCADKVFFCNSGAEANEAAIKLSRKYAHTKLNIDFPVIITAHASFHGRTLTTITATGQPKYQKDFGPLTPGFEYTEYNNIENLRALVKTIQGSGGGRGLAAIMMESLQGEGGVTPGTKEFFKEVRRLCDETGAVMIMDEVQTGVGRTGKMWGYENLDIIPDVFTSAKAIGGGVPLGAMMCREKFNVFGPGDHASTYGGNPLACAAGLAVAECFETMNLLKNCNERGEQLRKLAREIQSRYPQIISEVRGWGLMIGIQISESTKILSSDVAKELLANGVLVVPAGPKVVRFVPPLIISENDVVVAMERFESAIKKILTTL